MFVNIIKSYRDVVAVCDKEILGKRFEEPLKNGVIRQLDVKENFYRGLSETRPVSEEEAIKIMQRMSDEDATFNIVGKKSVSAALKAGVVTQESVGKIQGIPFALVLL